MKKLFILLLIIGILFCGCAPYHGGGELIIINKIPWKANEIVTYNICDNSKKMGEAKITIKEGKGGYVLVQQFNSKNKFITTEIELTKKDLLPILSTKTIRMNKMNNKHYKIIAKYGQPYSRIILTDEKNKKRVVSLQLPKESYDNDSLLYIMRAYPFDSSRKNITVSVCMPQVAQIQPVNIKIFSKKEEIKTSIGNFKCYKVEFKLGEQNNYAWYYHEKPYYLVKYTDTAVEYIINTIKH